MRVGKQKAFKAALALMAVLCLISCGKIKEKIRWNTYHSIDNLFKIDFPRDWNVSLDGHTFNITPPDATGLVAVTGYLEPGTEFNEKAFENMVMRDFFECHVKEPFAPVTFTTQWTGEDALYEKTVNDQKVIYLFRVAHLGQVGVFIAVSELAVHMGPRLPVYKKIMDSLFIVDTNSDEYKKGFKIKKWYWQDNVIAWLEDEVFDWLRSTEPKDNKPEGESLTQSGIPTPTPTPAEKHSYFGY
jgi:hypothetical protein